MKIGQIEIPQLCRLAPMAAISNAPFRLITKECGSGLTTTEEMDAFALLMDTRLAGDMAVYYPQERPLAMQLLGRDPQALIRASHRCEELGADIVDLNMGCPMPEITGKGKGAALMRGVPGTAPLLRAMRQTIAVPFTIKIRGGWDDLHLNAVEVARMAENEGVDTITEHPRTRSRRFTGARRVQARKGPTMIPKKQPDRSIDRSHSIAILDAVHVLLASVFAVGLTLRVASTTTASGLVPLALGLALGFLAADVASGLVHWFCDRYFQPNTLLIGPMIIAPFRQHHVDPTALGRHGVLERNGNNCLAALPFLTLAVLEPWGLGQPWAALARAFLGGFSLTLCLTNEIHAWAHSSSPPQLVTWLQRCGILLARERHAAHHRDSHSRAYAVVCGWSNLWLDCILVRAEVVLASLGVSPSERGSKQ